MKDKWISIKELDLDSNLTRVDTRDFCGYNDDCKSGEMKDIFEKVKLKYRKDNEDTVFTKEELKSSLNQIYKESGGQKKWRLLSFVGDKRSGSWIYKYMNIYKLDEDCYIIEGKQNDNAILLSKSVIAKGVNKDYLNAH